MDDDKLEEMRKAALEKLTAKKAQTKSYEAVQNAHSLLSKKTKYAMAGKEFKDLKLEGVDPSDAEAIEGVDGAGDVVGKAGEAVGAISDVKDIATADNPLSGAVSGASLGLTLAKAGAVTGPIGAVIGGVVGGIAGILGAKAKRKQEEKEAEAAHLKRMVDIEGTRGDRLQSALGNLGSSFSAAILGQQSKVKF